jgi:catechol 2,3-dioxygenase-like lactoylglutathione lyase family enzyme
VPQLNLLRTILTANDLAETVAFYEKLGFECVGMMGEPKPFWCQEKRDAVWLMFNQGDPEPHDDGDGEMHVHVPGMEGGLYINVDDADALYADFKKVIDSFEFEPTDQPYNMREFAIRDCNGYTLYFGSDITPDA